MRTSSLTVSVRRAPAWNPKSNPSGVNNIIDLNFCTQNVRSLNIATKNLITEQKILAITKSCNDIVFLSDLRLNSLKQITACKEITKRFYFNGYKFIHNSPTSARGVGILIKKTAMEKLTIMNTVRDLEGNYLLIDIEHKNQRFSFGAVYGANTNDGIHMYVITFNGIFYF
jgi:hypothetical protein